MPTDQQEDEIAFVARKVREKLTAENGFDQDEKAIVLTSLSIAENTIRQIGRIESHLSRIADALEDSNDLHRQALLQHQ